jgi:eukaryotic-like serine/threonine-protein kinase
VGLLEPASGGAINASVEAHLAVCSACRDVVLITCMDLDGSPGQLDTSRAFCLVFEPGTVVERRFCIRRLLGRGGMGEVYEAFDLVLRRAVALKAVRANACDEPGAAERLMMEVHIGQLVDHPNVCRTYQFGQYHATYGSGSIPFYTMQLIEGETLRRRLKHGPLHLVETISLARQALSGLRAIHEAGIVHRDVKSDNIMLSVKGGMLRTTVLDLGLACRHRRSRRHRTNPGSSGRSGSLAYMAPEQMLGQGVGPAADVFGLGVVIFEALTGRLPFYGPRRTSLHSRSEDPAPNRPRAIRADTPTWLDDFIQRCLRSNPADRFADAADAEKHFEQLSQGAVTKVNDTILGGPDAVGELQLSAVAVAEHAGLSG